MTNDLSDVLATRAWAAQHIWIWAQDDDGTWRDHPFANEAAAAEFEAKGRQRGFPTSRVDPR
jgi:hypothetical protein